MANFLLLTGAGFSRNWGAWLADEVFEYLLGSPDLRPAARDSLWRAKARRQGFEYALAELGDGERQHLESVIAGMLNQMNTSLKMLTGIEFSNDHRRSVKRFLANFDAIFTLNFDLLLEEHYLDAGIELLEPKKRWSGTSLPGIATRNDSGKRYQGMLQPREKDFDADLHKNTQPYFKLHGSSNWITPTGRLIVMGGDKALAIDRDPILKWSNGKFHEYLHKPETRLLIIGYGFLDKHINAHLESAASMTDFKVFIVDPNGVDAIDPPRPPGTIGSGPSTLMSALRPRIVGASRRRLSDSFGTDGVEFGKIWRFFEP
jgi:hypothetical protein